jgi:hypothetical protein
MEVSHGLLMEEAGVLTTEYLPSGEEGMASFLDGNVSDLEALDFLRRSFVKRIVQKYYGVLPSNGADVSGEVVLTYDDLVTARYLADRAGMQGTLEEGRGVREGPSSDSGGGDQ